MKRVISILLVLSLISIVSCTPYDYQNHAFDSNESSNESLLNPADYGTTYLSEDAVDIEERNAATVAVKQVIKIILKNHRKAVPVIEEIAGKKAANAFSKGFYKVEPKLRDLLRWSDVSYQAVEDVIYRGLTQANINAALARKAAHAVKVGLSWIV